MTLCSLSGEIAPSCLGPPAPTHGMFSLNLTPTLPALPPTPLSSVHSAIFSGMLQCLAIEGLKPNTHPARVPEHILTEGQFEASAAFF